MIDNGSATATELRSFLEENQVDLGKLINNLVITGEVQVKHLDGIRQVLVVYPYVVAGGFTVVDRDGPDSPWDAHFGLIINDKPVCKQGYEGTDKRRPTGESQTGNAPMNDDETLIAIVVQ